MTDERWKSAMQSCLQSQCKYQPFLRFAVGCMTFAMVSCSSPQSNQSDVTECISFDQIAEDPLDFDGRHVCVIGALSVEWDGVELRGRSAPSNSARILVVYPGIDYQGALSRGLKTGEVVRVAGTFVVNHRCLEESRRLESYQLPSVGCPAEGLEGGFEDAEITPLSAG